MQGLRGQISNPTDGMTGASLHRTSKELAEEAEKSSYCGFGGGTVSGAQ